MEILILIGILLVILGIATFFVPKLENLINLPGNRNVKAVAVIIIGIIFIAAGKMYGI